VSEVVGSNGKNSAVSTSSQNKPDPFFTHAFDIANDSNRGQLAGNGLIELLPTL